MASTYYAQIQQLYVAYFKRPADPAGLAYWQSAIDNAGGSTAQVSAAFAASAEYKAEYQNLSARQTIDRIYHNLFGRSAEIAGETYWADLLTSGKLSIDTIVKNVADGALGADKSAYANKVQAATLFSAALDTPQELQAYSGNNANAQAKAFIEAVSTDASLAAALAPGIDKIIETVLQRGAVTTLTINADLLPSAGYNSSYDAPYTAGGSTLQSEDSIIGGAGLADKLRAEFDNGKSTATAPTTSGIEQVTVKANALQTFVATSQAALLDAAKMRGVTQWESNNSSADLVITNANIAAGQSTKDVSIVLRESAAGNTDFGVYFEQGSLRELPVPGASTGPVSSHIVLDDVGRGGLGGDLVVGAQKTSDWHGGIERFYIEVQDNSQLQTIASSDGALSDVIITNGVADKSTLSSLQNAGNLSVLGALTPSLVDTDSALLPEAQAAAAGFGFTNLRTLDAAAMTGRLNVTAQITKEALSKYALSETGNVYLYRGGANVDSIQVSVDSSILKGKTIVLVEGGAGNDDLTLSKTGADIAPEFTGNLHLSGGAGNDTLHASAMTMVEGGSGDDLIVLSSAAGRDALIYQGSFGSDVVQNFQAGTAATADSLDFSVYGASGSAFSGAAISNADKAITIVQQSTANDSIAEIAALYTDGTSTTGRIFIAYDSANVGKVYSVSDSAATAVTVTLVGSIDLATTSWGSLTANNFN